MEQKLSSCAECKDHSDPMKCKKFNNFVSKLFAFVFKSNRAGCLDQIRNLGLDEYAKKMAASKQVTIKHK
jgi:hypothetical protein